MFVELWQGLRDLLHDNTTTQAKNDAKRFINWTIRDLANEYDWEFLRGSYSFTATAGPSLYDINPISQITGTAETFYVASDATADGSSIVTIYGKSIGASSVVTIQTDPITLIATATATGASQFSTVDSIIRAVGSGTVSVYTSTGGTVATLSSTETYKANDIGKINKVINTSNNKEIIAYDYNTYQHGNPNNTNLGNVEAYDLDYLGQMRLMNISTNTAVTVLYQRIPKYLVNDQDRTEFPYRLYPAIIEAAYEGWGLRYMDEQDGVLGKQAYKEKLREIITAYILGGDQKRARVMPSWYKRTI